MALSIDEQETHTYYNRRSNEGVIITTDTTEMRYYDNLGYHREKVVRDKNTGEIIEITYTFDKHLRAYRKQKRRCYMTEEQRKEAGRRLAAGRAKKQGKIPLM